MGERKARMKTTSRSIQKILQDARERFFPEQKPVPCAQNYSAIFEIRRQGRPELVSVHRSRQNSMKTRYICQSLTDAMKIPEAKAAVDTEWNKLKTDLHGTSKDVKPKEDVVRDARDNHTSVISVSSFFQICNFFLTQ